MVDLAEGMRSGDLEGIVLPLISVDEYESNIDDNAVVIGFFVHDQQAARDLNRFIQKSSMDFLDAEISPAPDQRGYFMVFVEFLLNETFPETVMALVKEISPLVGITSWKAQVRGLHDEQRLTVEVLRKIPVDAIDESVGAFLADSALNECRVGKDRIRLSATGFLVEARIVGFGELRKTLTRHGLSAAPVIPQDQDAHTITRMLGIGWQASRVGTAIAIEHANDPRVLLLDV